MSTWLRVVARDDVGGCKISQKSASVVTTRGKLSHKWTFEKF